MDKKEAIEYLTAVCTDFLNQIPNSTRAPTAQAIQRAFMIIDIEFKRLESLTNNADLKENNVKP